MSFQELLVGYLRLLFERSIPVNIRRILKMVLFKHISDIQDDYTTIVKFCSLTKAAECKRPTADGKCTGVLRRLIIYRQNYHVCNHDLTPPYMVNAKFKYLCFNK